jgi:hypothetical protein
VLSAGCSPYLQPATLSECIANALPGSGALPDCAIGAATCAELEACVGRGFYAEACPPGSAGTICVDSKVVDCDNVPHTFVDCARQGAACGAYSSGGDGTLDAHACAVEPACTVPTDTFVCHGTKRVRCLQGVGFGEDCAARGLGCVQTPAGATCAQKAAACSRPDTGRCDAAGNGSYCASDGRTLSFDCGKLGLKCREAPESTHGVECGDPACAGEDAQKCFEECDGPMAYLCVAGQRLSIDCQSYGFPSCILETRADVGDRARCGRH